MLAVSPGRLHLLFRSVCTSVCFNRKQSSNSIASKGFYRLSLAQSKANAAQCDTGRISAEKADSAPTNQPRSNRLFELVSAESRNHGSTPTQSKKSPIKPSRPRAAKVTLAQDSRHEEDSEDTISLLEELFPEELGKSARSATDLKAPREIPYRPIGVTVVNEEGETEELTPHNGDESTRQAPTREKGTGWRYQKSTVLALRNAGKHLIEEDFRRVLPTGRHLEGWTSGIEGMKVIRSRDRRTLLPNGDYIILFRSASDAKAYLANARRLHGLSQLYTPKKGSLSGPLPPPPMPPPDDNEAKRDQQGMLLPQQSTHDELATYTLLPPSEALNLKLVSEPFSPFMRDLVQRTGYEQLIQDKRTEYEVMLHVDGWQPTLQALKGAVNDDGRSRHLHWDVEHRSNGIREFQLPKRENEASDEDEHNRTAGPSDKRPPRISCRVWKRWIVSFSKEDEARRFVSAWHRRDIAPLLSLRETAGLPPAEQVIMNADLIW